MFDGQSNLKKQCGVDLIVDCLTVLSSADLLILYAMLPVALSFSSRLQLCQYVLGLHSI